MKLKSHLQRFIVGMSFILLTINSASANSADCIDVQNGSIKEVQIKPQNGFLNCFYVDIPSNASARHMVAQSYNLSAFNLRELTMSPDGQLVTVKENWSDASAIVVSEVVTSGRVFFSVRPSNKDRLSKNVSVIAGIHEGNQVIHFGIEDIIDRTTLEEGKAK